VTDYVNISLQEIIVDVAAVSLLRYAGSAVAGTGDGECQAED
jgi:hypothetical protein